MAHGKARLIATLTNRKLDRIGRGIRLYLSKKALTYINSSEDISKLSSVYSSQILEFLISATTKSYIYGFDYVEAKTGQETKLTLDDEARIRQIAKKALDSFWNVVKRGRAEKNKEPTLKDIKNQIKGASAFDFIELITRLITTEAVNEGTISAAIVYKDTQPLGSKEMVYEFVTMRDDKVDCRICAPLDGMLMSESDFHFAQPPLHYGCRCRLILTDGRDTLSG